MWDGEVPRSGGGPCLQGVTLSQMCPAAWTHCSGPPTLLITASGPHPFPSKQSPYRHILLAGKGRGCCDGSGVLGGRLGQPPDCLIFLCVSHQTWFLVHWSFLPFLGLSLPPYNRRGLGG